MQRMLHRAWGGRQAGGGGIATPLRRKHTPDVGGKFCGRVFLGPVSCPQGGGPAVQADGRLQVPPSQRRSGLPQPLQSLFLLAPAGLPGRSLGRGKRILRRLGLTKS